MQIARIVQAVILMTIVAMAASCAASKQYTSKLFAPRTSAAPDSQSVTKAPRFLEVGEADANQEGWITTDIIMGRDTASASTAALDNLAKTYPSKKDSTAAAKNNKTTLSEEVKVPVAETEPVAKAPKPGEIRTRRTRE